MLEYDSVTANYTHGLNLALRKVTFSISHLEGIGIVGRTRAGETSLELTVLRALEIQSDTVRIGGMNTMNVRLHILRRRLAMIPQEPTLFAGTFPFSVDPTHGIRNRTYPRRLTKWLYPKPLGVGDNVGTRNDPLGGHSATSIPQRS